VLNNRKFHTRARVMKIRPKKGVGLEFLFSDPGGGRIVQGAKSWHGGPNPVTTITGTPGGRCMHPPHDIDASLILWISSRVCVAFK
jgi:hypothetical protein